MSQRRFVSTAWPHEERTPQESLPHNYPPDRYHGKTGEFSAWFRRSDQQPEVTHPAGGTWEYLVIGDQTEGRMGIYRWPFGEEESGPDPHFHRSLSEQLYVLSGDVNLYDGRSWVTARPGDFC